MDSGSLRRQLAQIKTLAQRIWANKKGKLLILFFAVFAMFFLFVKLPSPLFDVPYATLLRSQDGKLLDVSITEDQQWRFPPLETIPEKCKIATRLFEDEYFYYHLGVNPVSLARAARQNFTSGKILSGGSTISMQTVRMALGNKKRTYWQKIIEIALSFKLELTHKKATIFKQYVNHAPYGGNIVGLNAASWRYFSRPPEKLSWGEAAALAVLPNNPTSIFPGYNQEELIAKRNRLLDKICNRGYFDKEDLEVYKSEVIPNNIAPLPNHTPHLLQRAISENRTGENIVSTLDFDLQKRVTAAVKKYNAKMSLREINNAAALILDIKTGDVLAYVGNAATADTHAKYVDIITSPRSPGSLLKPFLYAAVLDDGIVLPQQLVKDVPLYYNGFIPKNFDRKFRGVVPADKALSSSLNVPFVHLLISYRYKRFYHLLKKMGYPLDQPPGHYGLSLILGTAESSLWEISSIYAGMARAYQAYLERPLNSGYSNEDYHPNNYVKSKSISRKDTKIQETGFLSIEAIEATFKAMQQLERPEQESGWESFLSKKQIAWKTGTSYGYKDAWAIGLNSKYLVGVWVGNADGEPRSDLVGVRAAAPLMFNLFRFLDGKSILNDAPMGSPEEVCLVSGMLATERCFNSTYQPLTADFLKTAKNCTYHQSLHLNAAKTHRVNSECHDIYDMVSKNYFVLDPVQAWYYKKYYPNYEAPPAYINSCDDNSSSATIQLLYPQKNAKILIPKEQDGSYGKVVLQAVHQNPNTKLFWHLNASFIGLTEENHQMAVEVSPGVQELTLVDDLGNEVRSFFTVLD